MIKLEEFTPKGTLIIRSYIKPVNVKKPNRSYN